MMLTLAFAAQILGHVSSPMNDYNFSVDQAERRLVFARSEADFRNARIFTAERRRGRWQEAAPIAFTDPRFSDTDPWLTPDGRTLYFVSDRPLPNRPDKRDLNIWRAALTASGWTAPEPLGPEVNSPGPELGPELHDGVLYFSSVRKGGRGGLDLYSARKTATGFTPATPFDSPFNSAESDSDVTFSADGKLAAFWRGNGGGRVHISHRTATGWSQPAPLGADVNFGPFTFTPSFSRDGKRLRFASTAAREGQATGLADIYEAPLTLPK
jgi:hypothetical protein